MMFRRLALLAVFAALTAGRVAGQENIVLTLAIPQWFQDAFNREYLAPFLEAHPGVDVILVPDSEGKAYPPSPAYASLDEHLEAVTEYVSSADVLLVSSWTLMPESTRAGLWLDLMPLVSADPALAEANFYPPAWRAFQWDRGMWGLPNMVEPQILLYDPDAFDEAGLTYPDANWSIEQYIEAATTLAPRDSRGELINAGCWCDLNLMLYGMLGHGLADANGEPQLEDPALAQMVEAWAAARDDIYPQGGYSSEGVAIMMGTPWILSNPPQEGITIVPGDLPGGVYGASVQGFAVSAGTLYPELAFELVKFLAENPMNGYASFGAFPALRQSEMQISENYLVTAFESLPPEQQEILQTAVETGLTGIDLRYFEYINQAVQTIIDDGIDATTALQQVQEKALQNLEAASSWTPQQPLMVATAIPTPSFESGEIVLDFGVSMWMLPNQQDWERLGISFAETDAEVGVIHINFQGSDYESWTQNNDCFYLEYDNILPNAVVTDYLALDPLLDADQAFDASDFVPGALEALQSQGQTYGYPFAVGVTAMRYFPEKFEEAGVPLPDMNWTVDQFADALNQLAQVEDSEYPIPFAPRMGENTDWLMLMAAYGGMPVDYSTEQPTWNFTDPAAVDAIRQVLDLAKAELADYQELATFTFSGVPKMGALMALTLNGYDNFGGGSEDIAFVNYPRGSGGAVMALGSVGGGYISTHADAPEACYRWFSMISDHPELLNDIMPARLSAIENPATAAAQGEAAVAFYREYAALASDPSTIHFPSQYGGTFDTYFIHQFLNKAFDAYVLEDADLEQALADAQVKADGFYECFINLSEPGAEGAEEDYQAYSDGIENCIALVDPEMAEARQEAMQR
jgi:ABC-type glycerol-3-phosphate transport system substrate-binding protein